MSRDLIAFQTNERRSPVPETPRTDDHNYRYHRYLLSLDGGGVRGLSTLLILKNIMHQVNAKRRERGFTCDLKPCDVFDLIGGTSTGGLIAIMLGRLEMDVDSCLETYREFIPQVFSKPSTFPITWSGNLRPRYSSKTLRETVIHIIGRRVGTSNEKDPSEVFLREDVPGTRSNPEHMCRVFVCATPAEHVTTTSRLRGYHVSFEGESFRPTIVQAALATTAAPTFFAPLKVPLSGSGSRSYVDGALHANNPIQVVEREAQDVFLGVQSETNPLTPYFTPYFLSIGTGILHKPESGSTGAKLLEALSKIATETETTAKNFRNHIRMDKKDWGYHRFNVEQGLQDMKMDEIDKNPEGRIEAVTEDYLRDDVIRDSICGCVNVLANKAHHPSSIVSLIEAGEKFLNDELFSEAYKKFEKADGLIHRRNPDGVDMARFKAINLGMATALYEQAKAVKNNPDLPEKAVYDLRETLDGALRRIDDVRKAEEHKSSPNNSIQLETGKRANKISKKSSTSVTPQEPRQEDVATAAGKLEREIKQLREDIDNIGVRKGGIM